VGVDLPKKHTGRPVKSWIESGRLANASKLLIQRLFWPVYLIANQVVAADKALISKALRNAPVILATVLLNISLSAAR
jgi:hypothetical protein